MATDYKASIKSQIEKFKSYKQSDVISAQELQVLLKNSLQDVVNYSRDASRVGKTHNEVVDQFIEELGNRSSSARELMQNYSKALNYWKLAYDEDERYLKVNKRFNVQAVLFRILTTLSIGFSIMIVYWVASCFNIPMPLLRLR